MYLKEALKGANQNSYADGVYIFLQLLFTDSGLKLYLDIV